MGTMILATCQNCIAQPLHSIMVSTNVVNTIFLMMRLAVSAFHPLVAAGRLALKTLW